MDQNCESFLSGEPAEEVLRVDRENINFKSLMQTIDRLICLTVEVQFWTLPSNRFEDDGPELPIAKKREAREILSSAVSVQKKSLALFGLLPPIIEQHQEALVRSVTNGHQPIIFIRDQQILGVLFQGFFFFLFFATVSSPLSYEF